MFILAKSTGWSEDFLLWQLPLVRALHYQHCYYRSENCWTVKRNNNDISGIKLLQADYFESPIEFDF